MNFEKDLCEIIMIPSVPSKTVFDPKGYGTVEEGNTEPGG